MYIIGGSSAKLVAEDISNELKQPIAKTIIKYFPDEEVYVRILDDIKGEDIILVQTTYPDTKIVELLLLQDALYEAGAHRITVVIPYFGYGRQDKKFEEGEPISAKVIAEHISIHADCILIVDPHKDTILDFFTIPGYICTAIPEIAKYIKGKNIDFILAPDKGARQKVKQAASLIGCDYDYLEKIRIDGKTVKIKPKNLDAKNKKVAIIDDIISTGGTMAESIKELKRQGAKKVLVACTHGLFVGGAIQKILSAGCDEIISTDTIKNDYGKVRSAHCITEALLKII